MIKFCVVTALFALLCLNGVAQADVFNLGAGYTNLETVSVGDAGNVGELPDLNQGMSPERIYGSVGYNYRIGKYEVTTKQYTDFLNAKAKSDPHGLYNVRMDASYNDGGYQTYGCNIKRSGVSGSYSYSIADDWANRPVNYVSFWDACRFVNWLSNGQGDGDTENGTYTIPNDYNGNDGRTIQRNDGWKWAITGNDEWYKAAYYKGGSLDAGYWDYAMQSDSSTIPSNDVTSPDGGNNANFYHYPTNKDLTIGAPYYRTNVGEFENSESAYGTFDQCGNVWELSDTVVVEQLDYASRGMFGGCFFMYGTSLRAALCDTTMPAYEDAGIGFRVVASVPEHSSIIVLAGGLLSLFGIRCRRA